MKYLNVPGLYNSGPQHWQSVWENSFPEEFLRVEQRNWEQPNRDEWIEALDKKVKSLQEPTILVAHSLGCITVAHWLEHFDSSLVSGALLVAPADVERSHKEYFRTFTPIPLNKFRIPSILIASTNDHYCEIHRAARWAAYWGSRFVCIGDKGHINSDSNLREWSEGLYYLKSALINSRNNYRAAI